MADILFGQSYFMRFDPKLWKAMQPYPPLGALIAASVAREAGYQVAFFDSMLAGSTAEWAAALDRHRPRYAVIYEDNFNYLSKMCLLAMRRAAMAMIAAGKARGCTVIAAGSDATDHASEYLAAGADTVILGEGEETLKELLEALEHSPDRIASVRGLAYAGRDGAGRPVVTGRRPDISDLDALPPPAWDLADMARYKAVWLRRHGYYSMNLATTRGCPYHCNWCAKPIWGQRYHSRSPEAVAAEMKRVRAEFGPDHIWFADDIFGLKPGWTARLAQALAAEGVRIPFKCLSRADLLLREGEVEALKQAGCEIVWLGAESGSQKILDAMDKGIRVEQIRQAADALRRAGIKAGFFLQFGYPGETRQDIAGTLQLVRDCQPDDIGISVSYPLPGTKFYAAVREQLGRKQNWVDSSDLDMMYAGPFSSDFYRQLHSVVHKEFRARQTWRRVRQGQRVGLRRAAAMAYQWASLPLTRARLERLARAPHRGVEPLAPTMRPEDAARPSAQQEPDGHPAAE